MACVAFNVSRLIKIFLVILSLALVIIVFSYRLLEVPAGLTIDEAAFGYNAVLLSRTGHDQNGRFLPFFVLSIDGKDWRQPVTQYYMALFFKIFGPSVFNLRFTSITITLMSAVLLFLIAQKLLDEKAALFLVFVFLSTPLIMIQSHLGLDNIMPIPFGILWLLGVWSFCQSQKRAYLVLSGISLGIGFYTYKGMRATVPVWSILTLIYLTLFLVFKLKLSLRKTFGNLMIFCIAIFPFFAIIPFLEFLYAGAVFGGQHPSFDSIYDFLYPYFSSYDPTFLFIKGDATLFHSTQRHGMMLLATLPLFLIGCYQAVRKGWFWLFILSAFFTAPFLYGLVGSVHRASRLMVIIPLYCLLATLGAFTLWHYKRKILTKSFLFLVIFLMILNYLDFLRYYWFTYPKFTESLFGHLGFYKDYEIFAKEAKEKKLTPYICAELYDNNGESGHFFESIYFSSPVKKIPADQLPPPGSLLMTYRQEIPKMKRVEIELPYYFLQLRE